MAETREKASVLPAKYGSGPLGLDFKVMWLSQDLNQSAKFPGDPEDRSLRKVETEVLIPKKMRDLAKVEKCALEVQKFSECCSSSSLLMVFTCRTENAALKDCLGHWYQDEGFKSRCKDEYLKERSEYRKTGIQKKKTERLPTSM